MSEKILKKDIDLDFDELGTYKIIGLIGAEPLKYIAGMTGNSTPVLTIFHAVNDRSITPAGFAKNRSMVFTFLQAKLVLKLRHHF